MENKDIINSLKHILNDGGSIYVIKDGKLVEVSGQVMQDLVIYVTDFGHRVHNAGVQTGRQLEKGDLEPGEEQ